VSTDTSLSLAERCRRIELLVLDVDGVMTRGGITYAVPESRVDLPEMEVKEFFVRDGLGLKLWRDAGKQLAILSGRRTRVVEKRAAELGIARVMQGVGDKGAAVRRLAGECGSSVEQTAFVGDDLIDVPALLVCGLAVAVADACPEVLLAAHLVTLRPGGRGAVREAVERILRCQGKWPAG
jgi:3-deoxy-D-manno-octulosonate 8-phosphate phosphatase (KDO 8-P phosphatase)